MKLKRFFSEVISLIIFILIAWLAVSWVDVLLHNDPVYGDRQYMTGNAIVLLVELAE